jgi:hypothetical protein
LTLYRNAVGGLGGVPVFLFVLLMVVAAVTLTELASGARVPLVPRMLRRGAFTDFGGAARRTRGLLRFRMAGGYVIATRMVSAAAGFGIIAIVLVKATVCALVSQASGVSFG